MVSEKCQLFNFHMCGMCCRNIKHYKEEVYPILKKGARRQSTRIYSRRK